MIDEVDDHADSPLHIDCTSSVELSIPNFRDKLPGRAVRDCVGMSGKQNLWRLRISDDQIIAPIRSDDIAFLG